MKELSLHILDIVQNSVRADAHCIELTIDEDIEGNRLTITIKDDGKGIPEKMLAVITDPFVTTRTTRRVGLGISLFKEAAETTGGDFNITSTLGKGTTVKASFVYDSIDRVPLGNMPDTIITLLMSLGGAELVYTHCVNGKDYVLDTREIKEVLEEDDLMGDPDVLAWIRNDVEEGLEEIQSSS